MHDRWPGRVASIGTIHSLCTVFDGKWPERLALMWHGWVIHYSTPQYNIA